MSERCSSWNRSGKRCGAWALTGATRCALHSDPRRAAQLGSKHGCRRSSRLGTDPIALPYKPLKTMGDVSELLEETINRVRQGTLDLRSANTIGFLASVQMKTITVAQAQAEALEAKTKEERPSVYMAFFGQQRSEGAQEEKVYDLYPKPEQDSSSVVAQHLPAEGEPVDHQQIAPDAPEDLQSVITVEINP